jgi:hypothetical protein
MNQKTLFTEDPRSLEMSKSVIHRAGQRIICVSAIPTPSCFSILSVHKDMELRAAPRGP